MDGSLFRECRLANSDYNKPLVFAVVKTGRAYITLDSVSRAKSDLAKAYDVLLDGLNIKFVMLHTVQHPSPTRCPKASVERLQCVYVDDSGSLCGNIGAWWENVCYGDDNGSTTRGYILKGLFDLFKVAQYGRISGRELNQKLMLALRQMMCLLHVSADDIDNLVDSVVGPVLVWRRSFGVVSGTSGDQAGAEASAGEQFSQV